MRAAPVLLLLAALAGCGGDRAGHGSDPRLLDTRGEAGNWLSYNGGYDEQRHSSLNAITDANVGRLGLSWSMDIPTPRGQESTPLVVDGRMYVTTSWSKVIAIDAATGRELWNYDPKVPGESAVHACCDVVNRGAAYSDGRIFFGTIDGRLIALNAADGRPVWSVATTDPATPHTITGAPRVMRGKVVIGNGGAEYGARGYVSAYDERTGRLVWRFYTVPGQPGRRDHAASDDVLERLARPTWFGDAYWKIGGGGTVWDSIVYDARLNRLYIGVGNGGSWDHLRRSQGKGDNLFIASVVALDPDTGRYLWHYQETPGDTWDFTSTQQMILATLPIGGKMRDVILHAPKNGFFYVIDRTTGRPLSARKFAPANWADRIDLATGRPVENPGARYRDKPFAATIGGAGAHNWHPMSYDPHTRLVFIPAQQLPAMYRREEDFAYRPGLWNTGVDFRTPPLPTDRAGAKAFDALFQGSLVAWDPVAQKPRWTVQHDSNGNGGVLSTAGNLVFQGLKNGRFEAYRATDGKRLWSFDAHTPIMAGPISFRVGGVQYVAVVSGYGGAVPLGLPDLDGPRVQSPGRVMVFRLGGTGIIAPSPGGERPAIVLPAGSFTPAQQARGRDVYAKFCVACHAVGTMAPGIIPDLKRSGALGDAATWRSIVIGGALHDQGMASFAGHLRDADAEAVRAYVAGEAGRWKDAQATEPRK